MKTIPIRTLGLAACSLLALLVFQTGALYPSRADEPTKLTVKITDLGFDPLTVQVEQGKAVELTFLWAQTAYLDDQHVIALEGYNVSSDQIDRDHTQATVKFIATKVGSFNFKCDIECDLHPALQTGTVKVVAGSGGGATASLLKPTINANPSLTSVKGDSVVLAAQLLDPSGQPITKAEVHFLVEEQFVAWTGLAEVGVAKTGPAGIAQVVYRPSQPASQKLVIRFPGAGLYDAAELTTQIPASRLFGPRPPESSVSLHGLRTWAPTALLIVIVGIWLVFLTLLFEVARLSHLRS